ncbi:S-adenosyl-L-methionine-dependent methyltransferase [Scleroderma yunnanense]
MVSLNVLSQRLEKDRKIEGAGFAAAKMQIDEDEGQEDDLETYDDDLQYIRLTTVRRYIINYLYDNRPLHVETDHAVYELIQPSKKYKREFRSFYKPQRIMQLIISSAYEDPEQEFEKFVKHFTSLEILDQPLVERDLWDVVPQLRPTLETIPHSNIIRGSYVISYLLSRDTPRLPKIIDVTKDIRSRSPLIPEVEYKGNPDLAVLRTENQIPTHVTSRIAQLAAKLFKERLIVVGRRPVPDPEPPNSDLTLRVKGFLQRVSKRRIPEFRAQQRLKPRSRYLKYLTIDGVDYSVGDTVLFVAGYAGHSAPPELPHPDDVSPTDILADYFWFARIVYIDGDDETVHVQWFDHSSKTIVEQLGHPQELFLTTHCDTVGVNLIIGRVEAHYIAPGQSLAEVSSHDFFYRYEWDDHLATFKSVDIEKMRSTQAEGPPDCCHICDMMDQFNYDFHAHPVRRGVAWHQQKYHVNDFVLLKADEGPCHIGHIRDMQLAPGSVEDDDNKIIVAMLGRVDKLGCRPPTVLKDERHLFYTDYEMSVVISDLVGICYVVVSSSLPEIEEWKAISPLHFYINYRFRSLNVLSWNDKIIMQPMDLDICKHCLKPNLDNFRQLQSFMENGPPLRVFDPFAGVGAFPLAMEESGCFELTHAIEISPSAARTLKKNTSHRIMIYNQCSNRVLRQAILIHENKMPDDLRSIEGNALPNPPLPGEIDCIIAGFPCQPHSQMNMFKRANDKKSNLILNILSWVDFLKPRYCIFENVRGFLQYGLKARQDGLYRVKGGIAMGGLKLVLRALTDMDYQVRFGLLQAGHYGTPQTRVRFFLIAAKRGFELPDLPEPTHDFPIRDKLDIKFPNGLTIQPIRTLPGLAPHRYVSTHDAISDLPVFHWRNPRRKFTQQQMREDKLKDCMENRPWCGFSGRDTPYEHEPQTTFQVQCRKKPTKDIQHYTRTYEPKKVERVVSIPMRADADYRDLPQDVCEWQLANPQSASARKGFQPGYYGRVPKDEWFQTTVTNVDPTAKQCRVLHPYCDRVVTVRELARSQGFPDHFVFHAIDDRVVTMHRQIGNAVSWPVSVAIAREFRKVLLKKWIEERKDEDVMEID